MPTQKLKCAVFGLVLSILSCGCGLLGGQPGQLTWPEVAQCGPSVPDLVATISRILLGSGGATDTQITDRARGELEGLAREHGADTVACLTDLLIRQWTQPGAAASPERAGAAARGADFLADVGTRVDSNPAFEAAP